MRQLTIVLFLFISLLKVKAQEPINTLPQKATVAYKSVLSKLGLTISNQSNAFWVKDENSSDVTEYSISLTNATTLPFKSIFNIRYFQDKTGEDQIEIQLRFKMQNLKNTSFKPFSDIRFKNTISKCSPTNFDNQDIVTLLINYDFKEAVISNVKYEILYYLISAKKQIYEDCKESSLDSDEVQELIELRKKI